MRTIMTLTFAASTDLIYCCFEQTEIYFRLTSLEALYDQLSDYGCVLYAVWLHTLNIPGVLGTAHNILCGKDNVVEVSVLSR